MTERRYIEIEGQIIREVSLNVLSEAPLDDLASRLVTRAPLNLPLLPRTPVRHLRMNAEKKRGLIVVETPPRMHGIRVQHSGTYSRYSVDARRTSDTPGVGIFNVMLPYQYFMYIFSFEIGTDINAVPSNLTIISSWLFWRTTPLRNAETDLLSVAAVPNVNSGGNICWGNTQSDNSSFAAKIDDLVGNFWNTVFNEDLGHRTPFGTSLTRWEENSDPLTFAQWPYWTDRDTTHITIDDFERIHIRDYDGRASTIEAGPPMQMDPAFIEIPAMPPSFTVARAHQWLTALDENQRRRMLAAMHLINAEATATALAELQNEVPEEQRVEEAT